MDNFNSGLFQKNKPQEINVRLLINEYLRYWYLFLICLVVFGLAAFFYLRYKVVPEYIISSTLLIKDGSSEGVLPTGFSTAGTGTSKTLGSEMIILKSENLIQRVFSELAIHTSYFYEGRMRNLEVFEGDLPISLIINKLNPSAYGNSVKVSYLDNNNFNLIETGSDGEEIISTHKFGQEINNSYGTFTIISSTKFEFSKDIIIVFHDLKKTANNYRHKLIVYLESNDANVIRLSLTDNIPQRGIIILNKLVEVYNKEAVEDKMKVDYNSIEFLDERIEFLSTELSEVEKNVEQYKQRNNLTEVGSNAQLYLESASEYKKEVESFELQLEIINSLEAYINKEDLKLIPNSLNIQDPTLNGLIAKYNELLLERQRMLRTIQPSSSLIYNIEDQLFNLSFNIRENLKSIKNTLLLTRDNLHSTSTQFQSKIRQVPVIERELMEINRQQNIKNSIYVFLLQRREEAGLSLASTTSNSRIIDSATANGPYNNKSSSLYMAALSLGLLLPFGFIYLKDFLNDKVRGRKDVEEKTNVPILGEIYHSESKRVLQLTEGNQSIIAETFRLVRANLHFANLGKENKVVLITSSRSGEGKTFCGINLGASIALTGKRVIIVDFDFRRPKLLNYLNIYSKLGITDYLVSNTLDIESIINPLPDVRNLYVIGAGSIPPNPAELILSSKIKNFIEVLRERFDFILLDSPPIGLVADTYNLAPYIDSTLYIIRYNYSYKAQIQLISEIYQSKKLNQPMLILNGASKRNGQGYAYGYGYTGVKGNSTMNLKKIEFLSKNFKFSRKRKNS